MLYHCLFLHLILEIPSDVQRWNRACDLAVYRLICHEKKEYRPAILYSQSPELPEACAMDDHQFWKKADRKKLLEQMKNLWNNSYGTGGFGLYGSDGRGASRGVCRKKSVCEKNAAMIFIVFSDILPFTARNFIQIQKVLTIFLISMVWNIMAICHSLNIWNTRR